MKHLTKTLLAFFAIALITSCTEPAPQVETEPAETPAAMSDADFQELWTRIDALWEQKDPALIGTVFAENFTRVTPGGTITNADELTNELNVITGAYPDMTLDLVKHDIKDNMVVMHWTVNGTFSGELLGVQGNGNAFTKLRGVSIITVENGMIVNDDSYWNTLDLFMQTGYEIEEGDDDDEEGDDD